MSKTYLQEVRKAHQRKLQLTVEAEREIQRLYQEVQRELEKKVSRKGEGLSKTWLQSQIKSIKRELQNIDKEIERLVKAKAQESLKVGYDPIKDFFLRVDKEFNLGLGTSFENMFNQSNKNVVKEIFSGNLYGDSKTISKRIWGDSKKTYKEIQTIISKGIIAKKSAYEVARDLEKFVNPKYEKPFNWSRVYPTRQSTIDYHAQTLARTSIQHAYQMAQVRSSMQNPFIEKIQWNSVFAAGRTCQVCIDRDGKKYIPEALPLDHPNGLCYMIPIITKSFTEIGEELREWVDGKPNTALDRWLQNYL